MPRRIIAVALPHFAAEARLRREGQMGFPQPFAIVRQEGGALRLASVNPAAAALGLAPGLGLADARAICPALVTRPAEPERLAGFRRGLARWAERFSPIVSARDDTGDDAGDDTGGDTLTLDATGCTHLFGGEAAMLATIATALAGHGLTARPAMADTRGAAWALAHYACPDGSTPHPASPPNHRISPNDSRGVPSVVGWGGGVGGGARTGAKDQMGWTVGTRQARNLNEARASLPPRATSKQAPIAPKGQTRAAIAALPVAALRLDPETAQGLTALGLATIGDAARIPRGALARRFGLATLKRLDQALGAEPEPVAPDRPLPRFATRLTLPEPIGHVADVMAGLERLLERLCQALETHQMGARALRLTVRRVDGATIGATTGAEIALARPGRDPARIRALFEPKVAEIEAGFGIDALRLEATTVEPLSPAQVGRETESGKLADLMSRIGNRIGFENVARYLPAESHIPERAFTRAAAAWSEPESFPRGGPMRPLTLFPPEKLEIERLEVARLELGKGNPGKPSHNCPGLDPGPRPATRNAPAPRITPRITRPGTAQEGCDPTLAARSPLPLQGLRRGPWPQWGQASPGEGMGRGSGHPPPPAPDPHLHPPDYPPGRFRWRRRWLTLAQAQGPERLAPEWWWDDPAWRSGLRDYWRVETAEGPRLWLFRTPQGVPPGWWAHGAFA